MAPERGALRLTRVALFALAAVGLACAAHLAGGETVSPVIALAAVPAVMVVVNLLASARRGPASLLVGLGLTQAVLHLVFMTFAATRDCHVVSPAMTAMAGSAGRHPMMVSCGSRMAHGGVSAGLWPSGPMLLGHLLATGVLAVVLARGERAVWALARALGFRRRPERVVPRWMGFRRLPVAVAVAFRPRSGVARRGVRRRGPPGSVLTAS